MTQDLRELMETAAGDPPHRVSVEAVRRRMARRRRVHAAVAAAAAVVVVAAAGSAVAAGALRSGTAPEGPARPAAGPPRYYIVQNLSAQTHEPVLQVRATRTGRVTETLPSRLPGVHCDIAQATVANGGPGTFFLSCYDSPPGYTAMFYRFRLTSSGRATGLTPVPGGVLPKTFVGSFAAAPDGSQIAAVVIRAAGPTLSTNAAPEGILVINTSTGTRALWRLGNPGTVVFNPGQDLSFTAGGRELAVKGALCPRTGTSIECSGHSEQQLRAYAPAAAGGSLQGGQVLVRTQGQVTGPAGSMFDALITPGGRTATAVLAACPRRGTCTLSVRELAVPGGRPVRLLYQVRTGSAAQGIFDRFFTSDSGGRYLILDAGTAKGRAAGWISGGRLIPLAPANGNIPGFAAW